MHQKLPENQAIRCSHAGRVTQAPGSVPEVPPPELPNNRLNGEKSSMENLIEPNYGPLKQPKTGPTMFEVAERRFGRKFRSATELWSFVNTKRRDLELDQDLLAAGWRRQRKRKKILLQTADP